MQARRYSPCPTRAASPAVLRCPTGRGAPCPSTTTKIDRDQRDGLYELVRNHLGAVGDIWIALEETEDFATAERLGIEFGEDFRLLEDISWSGEDDRDSFDLTMPAHDLMELLQRLHGEAERVLLESITERESKEEDAATNERFRLGYHACEELLADLDPRS